MIDLCNWGGIFHIAEWGADQSNPALWTHNMQTMVHTLLSKKLWQYLKFGPSSHWRDLGISFLGNSSPKLCQVQSQLLLHNQSAAWFVLMLHANTNPMEANALLCAFPAMGGWEWSNVWQKIPSLAMSHGRHNETVVVRSGAEQELVSSLWGGLSVSTIPHTEVLVFLCSLE